MSELATLEKVVAVLCLTLVTVNILTAIEGIRTAMTLGNSWKVEIDFPVIAASVLSVCVIIRWLTP